MNAAVVFLASLLGSLGFGVMLQAPRASLWRAALIGAVSYLCYWALAQIGASEAIAMFCGAAIGSLAAQIAARRMRMAATVFITIAIIPLVPGLGLYQTMEYLAQGLHSEGVKIGVKAMLDIFMLALGVGVGSLFFRAKSGG